MLAVQGSIAAEARASSPRATVAFRASEIFDRDY